MSWMRTRHLCGCQERAAAAAPLLRACPGPGAQPGKMFPGIAVIGPEAKLPFSPGMNHAGVKCLCFRNPAEFTARPSLLLTCVCKSPAFFQYLAVIFLLPAPESHCRVGGLKVHRASAPGSQSCFLLGRKHPLPSPSCTGSDPTCWYF